LKKTNAAAVSAGIAVLALAACNPPGVSNPGTADASAAIAARGSSAGPTDIKTLAQLRAMSPSGNYRLMANITMRSTDAAFVPIGSPFQPFTGTFNGNGFTIDSLRTAGGASGWYHGLFSATSGALLTKIRLTHVDVKGAGYTGAIVGRMENTELSDSYVTGVVSGNSDASAPGNAIGLAIGGMVAHSVAYRCTAVGTVQGAGLTLGGFAGEVSGEGTLELNQPDPRDSLIEIFTNVKVNPTLPGPAYNGVDVISGGVAGYVQGAVVREINSVGSVYGRGQVGGVIGRIVNDEAGVAPTEFHMCLFLGKTTSPTGNPAGALGGVRGDLFGRCQVYYNKDADAGTPVTAQADIACNQGLSADSLKKAHYFPQKDFMPYIVGKLITQADVDAGAPACKLYSGSETDWGFGTCDTPRIWFTNASNQFNTLARVPEAGLQPL
jgi:hypothetical protein